MLANVDATLKIIVDLYVLEKRNVCKNKFLILHNFGTLKSNLEDQWKLPFQSRFHQDAVFYSSTLFSITLLQMSSVSNKQAKKIIAYS